MHALLFCELLLDKSTLLMLFEYCASHAAGNQSARHPGQLVHTGVMRLLGSFVGTVVLLSQ